MYCTTTFIYNKNCGLSDWQWVMFQVMKFLRNYWIPRYFIRHGSPYVDSMMAEEAKMKVKMISSVSVTKHFTLLLYVMDLLL